MAKKITTQNLVDTLRQRGWNAQQVEPFVDAFFKSLNDGITRDGIVKVKGLGTFKTIKVADRASVDVNTGERIVIPGHNKLKFVEEDKVNAVLNGAELSEPTPAPKKTAAKKETSTSVKASSPAAQRSTLSDNQSSQPSQLSSQPEVAPKQSRWWIWALIALVVVLISVFVVSILANNPVNETASTAGPKSSQSSSQTVNRWVQAETPTYKVHTFQKGESLTTISILYYNTTDSVPSIMQLNGLSDTSFIPLGTELKLP